jgi:hypothetical protein
MIPLNSKSFSCALAAMLFLPGSLARAQDNYEIQVYASETVKPGLTMFELHNNFTLEGSKTVQDGVRPTDHQWHETVEITHGFTPFFEIGFYIFTTADTRYGYQWVGDHIRPRFAIPADWNWPVGLSLSTEFGYQRAAYSADTWTLELRPIIDKQVGRWYLCFNPTVDRAFHGPGVSQGVVFSPNAKVGYDFTKKINGGVEYYGSLGPLRGFDPIRDQEQQIFIASDLNISPKWEFNFGVGIGLTGSTDHLILKMIIGRRFDFGHGGGKGKSGS